MDLRYFDIDEKSSKDDNLKVPALPLESILSIFVAEAILTIAGYPRLALARVRMFRRY